MFKEGVYGKKDKTEVLSDRTLFLKASKIDENGSLQYNLLFPDLALFTLNWMSDLDTTTMRKSWTLIPLPIAPGVTAYQMPLDPNQPEVTFESILRALSWTINADGSVTYNFKVSLTSDVWDEPAINHVASV